jgi:hypothetical protein
MGKVWLFLGCLVLFGLGACTTKTIDLFCTKDASKVYVR